MYVVNENDFNLLEHLISLNQIQTKEFLFNQLNDKYSNITKTNDYIIAEGEIPIALVAHMDTVFEKWGENVNEIYYDVKKGIMWNPFGAGFDDKAGIFSILKIIDDGYRPHIIFTCDEEIGSRGAKKLVERNPEIPFRELKYLIELDRANSNDCVFYECFNKDFSYYIESFGYVEAKGTSSDIKKISPVWKVAGVNLSIGYENQHTFSEILDVNAMFSTIYKVEEMLADEKNVHESFEFFLHPDLVVICNKCGHEIRKIKSVAVKKLDGETIHYCESCPVEENVFECEWCGDLVEMVEKPSEFLCEDCKGYSNRK
jgi:hypothetical protein